MKLRKVKVAPLLKTMDDPQKPFWASTELWGISMLIVLLLEHINSMDTNQL